MGFKINEQCDTKLWCNSYNFFNFSEINSLPANKKVLPINASYAGNTARNKQFKRKIQKQPNQTKSSNNGAL